MIRIHLDWVKEWLGVDLIDKIDMKRKERGEIQRDRNLGTLEMIWLFLTVAANSGSNSLEDIFEQALEGIGHGAKITVPAFCKRRKFFSHKVFI